MAVRQFLAATLLFALSACRGEKPPRDYQNNPPAMMHPVLSKAQSPAARGMPGPSKEPNSGGAPAPEKPVLKDSAPVTTT